MSEQTFGVVEHSLPGGEATEFGESLLLGDLRPDLLTDETLVDLFKFSARRFANDIAMVFDGATLTYHELDRWSDAVASELLSGGIVRSSFIAVWLQRGFAMHAAILGIMKAGSAYVPIDREIPAERVETILSEVGAAACFSLQDLNTSCKILRVAEKPRTFWRAPQPSVPNASDIAYVIFTSGSTGKPKGIPITHGQIAHLVKAEQTVLQIKSTDYVYQGFSVSFDMWCEETWISLVAGARLFIADNTTAKSIDELGALLKKEKITVLHAVPSLLAVMENDVPSLRLINAGGEACTRQVVEKWSKNGIQFFNSYGPTETTVTATLTRVAPGEQITIGVPLPNYNVAVVSEDLDIVPFGTAGELIITGPGLSSGYIGLPQLTAEKFLPKPDKLLELPGERLYRTGDSAVMTTSGIQLNGRLDDQVKLRGYRIELGEIEHKLNQIAGVASCAVALKKDSENEDQLVAYVISEGMSCIDETQLRLELAKDLPSYMVPGTIVMIDEMPRMPSGKIDRKALPVPEGLLRQSVNTSLETIDLNAPLQDRVFAVLRKIFVGKEIAESQDFFNDLGGHSLLAAGFVSQLRRDAAMPYASLRDVYTHRPLSALVGHWNGDHAPQPKIENKFVKVPLQRYLLCWAAQTISLMAVYGLFAFQIFIPYLGYYYVDQLTEGLLYPILTSVLLFCLTPPLFIMLSIASKWLIIGKIKAGSYPLWGRYYFRWWLVKTIQKLVPVQVFNGTPLYPHYLRALGFSIAPDVQLGEINFGAADLISLGSDVSISSKTVLDNAVVENGQLRIGSIVLEDHAYVGSSSIISQNSVIKAWGELGDLSHLQENQVIGSGEVWQGSPAQRTQKREIGNLPHPLHITEGRRRWYTVYFCLLIGIFPIIILLPLLPTVIAINKLDNSSNDYDFAYLVNAPGLAFIYIFLFALETIILSRLLQLNLKAGKYSLYSPLYLRKWFSDQLITLSLQVLHPIFATVFASSFFRALGAKIGKNTEISTAASVTHPLLEIGDGAFIADAVTLGESDIRAQQLILETTSVDDGTFVGNSALIPQGYRLGKNMLIGVLSLPPDADILARSGAKDWFGSPSIALPKRQMSNAFADSQTSNPPGQVRLARAVFEFLRILLPQTAIICFSIFFISFGHELLISKNLLTIVALFPIYYLLLMGVPAYLLTVCIKWLLVGRYKPKQAPMWTKYVWASEAITSTYEALAVPFLLEFLKGTPWLPLSLRLFGVKTGKRIWMNTTDVTEFDMVSIGDDAALNTDCGPQTHLFEDLVMKVGPVKIGARANIGSASIVLYDSEIGDDTLLEPLSLVMKGERIAPGTRWGGSPVAPLN